MNSIPGLKIDIGFGSATEKLPDWRKAKSILDLENDPDDDQIETPEDVKAMLGFDPASDDEKETTMNTRNVIADKLAANKCGLWKKKVKDRTELPEDAVENAGTSEGVKKSWQKRKAGGEGRASVWDAMTSAQRIRARSQDRQEAKKSTEKSRWTSRNSTMLEQASPSPMIGEYAEGKARRSVLADKLAAKNAGTSEGVRKSWLKRKHQHPGEESFRDASAQSQRAFRASYGRPEVGIQSGNEHLHAAKLHELAASKIARLSGDYQPHEGLKTDYGAWLKSHQEKAQFHRMKGSLKNKRTSAAFNAEQLVIGTTHEMEHTSDPKAARKIAADHLAEDPKYYTKLKRCVKD